MSYTVKETADFLNVSNAHIQRGMEAMGLTGLVGDDALGLLEGWVADNPEQQTQPKRGRRAQQPNNLAGASLAITAQAANARQPLAVLADRLAEQQISDAQNVANMLNPATYTEGVLLRAISMLAETKHEPIDFDLGLEGDDIFTNRLEAICGVNQPQLGGYE